MNGVDVVAELMTISAVTAPKAKGKSFVEVKVLTGTALKELADAMTAYGRETGKKDFDRDAKGVARSEALVLIGLKDPEPAGMNCGACGFAGCAELAGQRRADGEVPGPFCALRVLDMGIALGSAAKTAAMHNVDNRIMYRVGVVARKAGMVDYGFAMGIPLSVTGKSIFFDR